MVGERVVGGSAVRPGNVGLRGGMGGASLSVSGPVFLLLVGPFYGGFVSASGASLVVLSCS